MLMNVSRFVKLLIPVFLFSLLLTTPLYPWQTNGVAICTVAGYQEYPMIVSDGSGGAIITWQDMRGNYDDVYAQRINSAGSTLWTLNGVAICTAIYYQDSPTLVSDGSGGAIIIWTDARTLQDDIYAQRVDSTGSTLWTLNGVAITTAYSTQDFPTLISDGSGGAIITWQDERSGHYNIYAQRVNSAGSTLWTFNGEAISTIAHDQYGPTITSDSSGGAIITWNDTRSGYYNIYAQRVNSAGSTLWTFNGVAICTATNSQFNPVIESDGSNGSIITWFDLRNGSTYAIYAQRVNSTGSTLWTTNGVAICTAAIGQDYPMIGSDGLGGAIITWEDQRDEGNYHIYAQRVNSTGSTLWITNGVAISTATNEQEFPTIDSDGSGGAVITWNDYRNDTSGLNATGDIYAQRVNSSGSTLWTLNGTAVCTAVNDQRAPTIISDGAGGAFITWGDERNGADYDIYAQQVNGNGLVPVEDWFKYGGNKKEEIADFRFKIAD